MAQAGKNYETAMGSGKMRFRRYSGDQQSDIMGVGKEESRRPSHHGQRGLLDICLSCLPGERPRKPKRGE